MPNCTQCGKKVGFIGSKTDFWGNHFCSDNCKNKFKEKKGKSKEMKSQGKIKEIKCTCNQCKKVWHYLPKDERGQKTEEFGKDLIQSTACCCNPIGILVGGLRKRPRPLDQCPKCNSKNVSKKEIYYEKKS